jgi:endonuclease/exonuclease/phosphatase family metal-dependent hydrolase
MSSILLLSATLALSAHASSPTLDVETWNVGLAHGFVDDATARLPAILESLNEADVDLICLQEVWAPADRERIRDALNANYRYIHAPDVGQKKASTAPACKKDDIFGEDKFVSCLLGDCSGTSGDEKTNCIIDNCGPVLDALKTAKPECANALMAQVGKSSAVAMWNILRPIRKTGLYAYGGSDGLMLASKVPLTNRRIVDFSDIATLNRRRALVADVDVGGVPVTVACTHLTADLSTIAPYPGTFPSWGDENLAQVEQLLKEVDGAPATVLLGDFNCGPTVEALGLAGELEASCEAVTAAGYSDPAIEQWPGCTWCQDNTLNASGKAEHYNALIDHIFLRNLHAVQGGVSHDGVVQIKAKGGPRPSSLSDHYGYRITLSVIDPTAAR